MSDMQSQAISASCFEPARKIDGFPEVIDVSYDLHILRVTLTFENREGLVYASCATPEASGCSMKATSPSSGTPKRDQKAGSGASHLAGG